MNILNIINGLIGAIMAAIMGFSGAPATPEKAAQIQALATSTDAVVTEAVSQATETTPEATKRAYELGKGVGRLEAQADQITSLATTTMATAQPPAPAPVPPTPEPTPPPTAPAPEPVVPQPVSRARIVIINPLSGKGIDHELSTSADFDERGNPRNEVYVGAIVYGADGEPVGDAMVSITATDDAQNKTLTATGNVTPIYVNGQKVSTPYYPFGYILKTPGTHIIKFSAMNIEQQVSFEVAQ